MTLPAEFAIEDAPLGAVPGVRLHGELDLATAPQLTDTLDDVVRVTDGALVVDLGDVEFLDSSTIAVLIHVRALLARAERDLVIVCPHGPIRRVLELTGVSDLFALFASREAAEQALVPAGGARRTRAAATPM